jgi:uncharacterized protein (UPF0335 family)
MDEKLREMQNTFIVSKEDEEKKLIIDFARALISLELDIKEIRKDIKSTRTEAKANGVPIKKVNEAIANLKKMSKVTDLDNLETEAIIEALENDPDFKTLLANLVKKD